MLVGVNDLVYQGKLELLFHSPGRRSMSGTGEIL